MPATHPVRREEDRHCGVAPVEMAQASPRIGRSEKAVGEGGQVIVAQLRWSR